MLMLKLGSGAGTCTKDEPLSECRPQTKICQALLRTFSSSSRC